jgi:predicted nucleic acid-binding protein
MTNNKLYCLDSSVFIQGWTSYYSIELCPSYWGVLNELIDEGQIFATMEVKREIEKSEDDLYRWVQARTRLFRDADEDVQLALIDILRDYGRLVDSTKQRSIADPWVIAHAKVTNAVVVTKEQPSDSRKRIKIPDVCRALGISWLDDFQFCREIGIRFEARRM